MISHVQQVIVDDDTRSSCQPPPRCITDAIMLSSSVAMSLITLHLLSYVLYCWLLISSIFFIVLLYDYSLTSELETVFGNGHSQGDYLCQVSLKFLHPSAYRVIASRGTGVNRQRTPDDRTDDPKTQASRRLLLPAEAKNCIRT